MLGAVYKAHLSHLWAPHGLCPFSPTSHNPLYPAPLNKQKAKGEGGWTGREGAHRWWASLEGALRVSLE